MGNTQTTEQENANTKSEFYDGQRITADSLLKDTTNRVKFSANPTVPVSRREVEGVNGAFILDNVLSPDECDQFIALAENMGFGLAPVSIGQNISEVMTDFRNNKRVMWDAPADQVIPIWERVKDFLPKKHSFPSNPLNWKLKEECGLNERYRFYRYDINQDFKPHFDGAFRRSSTEKSHLTFIIYLNDGFEGGETTFYPDARTVFYKNLDRNVRVNPKKGSALVFYHIGPLSPLHEGSPHRTQGGRKYVLRSDVMYVLESEPEATSKPVVIDESKQGKDRDTQEADTE